MGPTLCYDSGRVGPFETSIEGQEKVSFDKFHECAAYYNVDVFRGKF